MSQNTGMVTMGRKSQASSSDKLVAVRREPLADNVELYQNVYVCGPEAGPSFARMLAQAKCRKAESVDKADLVILTGGGVDVHPSLYGDPNEAHETMYFENQLCIDTMCEYLDVWQEALLLGIPVVGICLGAQFLHVMHGGRLYQDVSNHYSSHSMRATEEPNYIISEVSSVHHQLCVRNDSMRVLGETNVSSERWLNRSICETRVYPDIEAFMYENTLSIGFQGHPEYSSYEEYTQWCLGQIQDHIVHSPRLVYHEASGTYRMSEKARIERAYIMPQKVVDFIKEYT